MSSMDKKTEIRNSKGQFVKGAEFPKNWHKDYGTRVCKSCKKKFTKNPRENVEQWNNRLFCSRLCYYEEMKNGFHPFRGEHHTEETKNKIREKLSGEKSHFWQGGIWKDPYPGNWTDTLRDLIRKRDNYTCQECGGHQDDSSGWNKVLDVHHIDYDKGNLDPKNLISLCRSCHAKTNYNRDDWVKRFAKIKCCALIIAKGSSIRLPNKNSLDFKGLPMFVHNLKKCNEIFEKVYVSSDCDKILETAKQNGAITIKRPKRLCFETPSIMVYDHAQKTMDSDIVIAV